MPRPGRTVVVDIKINFDPDKADLEYTKKLYKVYDQFAQNVRRRARDLIKKPVSHTMRPRPPGRPPRARLPKPGKKKQGDFRDIRYRLSKTFLKKRGLKAAWVYSHEYPGIRKSKYARYRPPRMQEEGGQTGVQIPKKLKNKRSKAAKKRNLTTAQLRAIQRKRRQAGGRDTREYTWRKVYLPARPFMSVALEKESRYSLDKIIKRFLG